MHFEEEEQLRRRDEENDQEEKDEEKKREKKEKKRECVYVSTEPDMFAFLFISLLFSLSDDFPSAQACVCRHSAAQAQLALPEEQGMGSCQSGSHPLQAPVS